MTAFEHLSSRWPGIEEKVLDRLVCDESLFDGKAHALRGSITRKKRGPSCSLGSSGLTALSVQGAKKQCRLAAIGPRRQTRIRLLNGRRKIGKRGYSNGATTIRERSNLADSMIL